MARFLHSRARSPRPSVRGPDTALPSARARGGLRTSEALQLLPSQVKEDKDGGLQLVDLLGKGGTRRSVYVLPGREEPIRAWLDARKALDLPTRLSVGGRRAPSPLICSISNGSKGKPLHARNVRAMLARRTARAGVEKRVPMHGLRHFHAYQLAQKGVKLHVVKKQLGHSRLDTTATYIAHLTPKEIGDEIRRAFAAA